MLVLTLKACLFVLVPLLGSQLRGAASEIREGEENKLKEEGRKEAEEAGEEDKGGKEAGENRK